MTPSASAIHAKAARFRSARSTAASTKKRLITCVWPQTDMLNQTAGLNKKRPDPTKPHRRGMLS